MDRQKLVLLLFQSRVGAALKRRCALCSDRRELLYRPICLL
jgi:hypothetical protein